MVFLTITPTILEALEEAQHLNRDASQNVLRSQKLSDGQVVDRHGKHGDVKKGISGAQRGRKGTMDKQLTLEEREFASIQPALESPKLGNPISRGQIIDLWKDLKARKAQPRTLDSLLRGARVYNPPPKPKPEPVSVVLAPNSHWIGKLDAQELTAVVFRPPNTKPSWPDCVGRKKNDPIIA